MSLNFREFDLELDLQQTAHIWSIVFRQGVSMLEEETDTFLDPDESAFVAEENGKIVAAYIVQNMPVVRGDVDLKVAGIAAVGVLPEHRHRGIGKQMMIDSLIKLREGGFDAALLYPYRASYYRQFGYEILGKRYKISCPGERLPRLEVKLPVRQVSQDELHLLEPVYESFIKRISGSMHRSPERWRSRMGRKPPIIYAVGDPIEAYATSGLEGQFWEDLRIGEFVWSSLAGYESMLGVLRGLGINRSALNWHEPSNSPFLAAFSDQGATITLDRQIQGRLIDVPGALKKLKPREDGEFRILVVDHQMPDNRGPWRVRFSGGSVHVEPAESSSIVMDIRHLTQAYFGEPSFERLLAEGFIQATEGQELDSARRLFPAIPVCCMEFF